MERVDRVRTRGSGQLAWNFCRTERVSEGQNVNKEKSGVGLVLEKRTPGSCACTRDGTRVSETPALLIPSVPLSPYFSLEVFKNHEF